MDVVTTSPQACDESERLLDASGCDCDAYEVGCVCLQAKHSALLPSCRRPIVRIAPKHVGA